MTRVTKALANRLARRRYSGVTWDDAEPLLTWVGTSDWCDTATAGELDPVRLDRLTGWVLGYAPEWITPGLSVILVLEITQGPRQVHVRRDPYLGWLIEGYLVRNGQRSPRCYLNRNYHYVDAMGYARSFLEDTRWSPPHDRLRPKRPLHASPNGMDGQGHPEA